ncbi:MAG: flagellar hook-basal body complex protein FliE [Deltaproteobacteria bacterium]|nr:flagellar hook-basal body complex protein FliE [Deltaproteobacteria bacterium]
MSGVRIEGDAGGLALRQPETAATSAASAAPSAVGEAGQVGQGPDFASIFEAQLAEASRLGRTATQKVEALSKGTSDDLHGTMISVKEAEISMKLVGAVRNKLLDAFHELWRINL